MIRDGRVVTPQRRWAWLVPVLVAGLVPSGAGGTTLGLLLPLVVGVLAGADWHWLNRRDVAARLAVPVLLLVLAATIVASDPGAQDETATRGLVYWASVVAGVVALEHLLRRRERHAWRQGESSDAATSAELTPSTGRTGGRPGRRTR